MLYAVFTLAMMVTLLGDVAFGSVALRILVNVVAVGAGGVWLVRDGNLLLQWARNSDRGTGTG
jgi:hypothetical protein